jgi:hypothetical protein
MKVYDATITRNGEFHELHTVVADDAEEAIQEVGKRLGIDFYMVSPHQAEAGGFSIVALPDSDEN